jgi:hypothetical protein
MLHSLVEIQACRYTHNNTFFRYETCHPPAARACVGWSNAAFFSVEIQACRYTHNNTFFRYETCHPPAARACVGWSKLQTEQRDAWSPYSGNCRALHPCRCVCCYTYVFLCIVRCIHLWSVGEWEPLSGSQEAAKFCILVCFSCMCASSGLGFNTI